MDFQEHLALVHPKWLRGLLSNSATFPKPEAFYVSGDSVRGVALAVVGGSLSATRFTWDAAPMEGQFIRARRRSTPLRAVESVSLDQSIGNLNAHGGTPELFDAEATIILVDDLLGIGKQINLPFADDDYAHTPEQRPLVISSFITAIESSTL